MPKDLTNITKLINKKSKTYRASYFHKNLTGSNGSRGLLNKDKDNVLENLIKHTSGSYNKQTYYTDISLKNDIILTTVSTSVIDLYTDNKETITILDNDYKIESHEYDTSLLNNILKLNNKLLNNGFNNIKVYNDQVPKLLQNMKFVNMKDNKQLGLIITNIKHLHAKSSKDKVYDRDIYIADYATVYRFNASKKSKHTKLWLFSPETSDYVKIQNDFDQILNTVKKEKNINHIIIYNYKNIYDVNELNTIDTTYKQALKKLNISDILAKQAEINDEYLIDDFVDTLRFINMNQNTKSLMAIEYLMNHSYHLFENAKDSLTEKDYKKWYNRLKKFAFKDNKDLYTNYNFDRLISINTRLSLTHQLSALDSNKNVYKFKPKIPTLNDQKSYSMEQLAIIETTSPYSVGVAGAGSGKSHTLLGRLDFLKQNGIDLKNVLVTSFTNVAADNILKRFNGSINSLTNANLFHTIYQENFNHTLTEDATLVNTLNTLSETSKLMQSSPTMIDTKDKLRETLSKLTKNGYQRVDQKQVTEKLIYLLQNRYKDIISILNALQQTTLTLEPIILSTMLKNKAHVAYPTKLKNLDFIITDESQDTSSFEYILLLQLTIENNAQLMIIGDANQTLYEFRNANPQFLNALERSETFKTYTMSTNYRSKQQILSFANEFLNILETNETAKIKLHANKYDKLTADKFKNSVQLENLVFSKVNGEEYESVLNKELSNNSNLRTFVEAQIKDKNQIAIMAYRNKDAKIITEHVAKIYQDITNKAPVIGITRNPTPNANTWLSSIVSKYHFNDLKREFQTKKQLTQQLVYNDLMTKLQDKADKNYRYTQYQIDDFAKKTVKDLVLSSAFKIYLNDVNNKKIPFERFIGYIKHQLINAETQHNSAVSRYFQQKPVNYKDADIVKTTIHSSKGLEFDSVICYFDETSKYSTTQENLRLYGVALTRAKNKELVINHAKHNYVNAVIVPSPFGLEKSDMLKTPMRTAYARVLQELKTSKTTI